jgi:hypothetical protein
MTPNQLTGQKHPALIKFSFISLFLIASLTLKAQTFTDFSGRWEFDKAASDKEERGDASFNGTIILEIRQTPTLITFANTFVRPGMADYIMQPDSFYVDGRVTTDNGGTGPAKKSAKWSQDKSSLTTTLIMTDSIDGVAQEFLYANTYKILDGGKKLVIDELYKSKLNGEKRIRKVYMKK